MWRHEEDSNIQWYMCKQPPAPPNPPTPVLKSLQIQVCPLFSLCENILTLLVFLLFYPHFSLFRRQFVNVQTGRSAAPPKVKH